MAAEIASLNGSGPQRIWLKFEYSSQSKADNYSTFYYEVRYYGEGYGSWSGDEQSWAATVAGVSKSGKFSIPQSKAFDEYQVIASGYVNKTHNSAGELANQNAAASINTNHASIGDGSVSVTGVSAPDIPTVPSQIQTSLSLSNPTAKGFLADWSAPNNGGSAIIRYDVQYTDTGSFSGAPIVTTGSTVTEREFIGREPNTEYGVRVRAVNGVGAAPWSPAEYITTLSGLLVSDGSKWVSSELQVSSGTAWQTPYPQISDGSAWQDPINV